MINKTSKKSNTSGKRRPTVLVTVSLYPPYTGGGPTYFSTLVDILKDRVDFLILTQNCPGSKIIERQENVRIYRIQPYLQYHPSILKYVFITPITLLALFYFWVKYRPVIHAHSSGIYGFVVGLFSSMVDAKIIKEVQDLRDPEYNLKIGKVNRYFACGSAVEKKLRSLGIPRNRIIKYPAINPPSCNKIHKKIVTKKGMANSKKPAARTVKLLFVGWLDRKDKGIDILLEAYKEISAKREDISLTLIGDGPDVTFCESFIKNNDLKNIEILGRIDYESTLRLIDRSDIIVLPSRLEAQGRAILEGFQFGKPAIATNVGGIPELVKDGKNGILIEPEDPKVLARAILRLADDKKLREELGRNGNKFLKTLRVRKTRLGV